MDQIFTKDALKAQIAIQALEMEMREKYYKHIKIKPAAQDGISRAAFNYIYFMFCYMKEYYQEDKQTISEMMQQLYKILVTGDYLCYECKRTKGYGQKIFEGVKTLFGYGKIGRISQIEEMNSLTRADLKTILLDPKIGELSKLKKVYQQSGFTLEVKETVIEEILDSVEHDPAGARSVKNTLNGLIDLSYFFDMAMSGYKKIIIHEGMLYGEPPHFMYGSSGKEEERWSL